MQGYALIASHREVHLQLGVGGLMGLMVRGLLKSVMDMGAISRSVGVRWANENQPDKPNG